MLHKLILTRVVIGRISNYTHKSERYSRTLQGAMRDGVRMLNAGLAIRVEIEDPNTGKIVRSRARGDASWTNTENNHVPLSEKDHPPD